MFAIIFHILTANSKDPDRQMLRRQEVMMGSRYDDFDENFFDYTGSLPEGEYGGEYGYFEEQNLYGDYYGDDFAQFSYEAGQPQDPEPEYGEGRQKSSGGKKSAQGNGKSRKASSGKRRKKKRKKKKKGGSPIFLIILLIIVLGTAFGAKLLLDKYSYSKETVDLAQVLEIADETDVPIIWGNEVSDIRAFLQDGVYYMALDDVKEYLNDRFYYGVQNAQDTTGMIIYCLPTDKLTVSIGSNVVSWTQQNSQTLSYVPAINVNGTIYLALEFVQEYTNFDWSVFTEPNRLQIDTTWEEQLVATINRRTQVRTSGGIKSPILEQLDKGEEVIILEQMETWSKVKTADSVIGYVENKRLTDIETTIPEAASNYEEPEYTHIEFDDKINMAFHNVWGSQGNWTITSYLEQTQDVNIIAPTWYWVSDDYGNLDKAATQDYVDTAHEMGLEVWAVVDNINSSTLEDNHTFLTTLDSRTNLISQLIAETQTYGIDGINVDFELIPTENGDDYIEFIRELSIACRAAGVVLSVDNYPAYSYNAHYNLEEQGVFVDYIVIMGYDEHYSGSETAGSVSSISYVTEGIQMALEVVEADRIINAIPFYSRIWKTTSEGVTSEAYGMQDIQEYITEHGMTQNWSSEAAQYYAETTEGDTLIQIWVEDAQSIKEKLDVMQTFGIKGVAEWRLQFETADVWDVISDYMDQ